MKLLSPPQGKSRQDIENAAQQLRAVDLDKLIKEKRKAIDDLQTKEVEVLSVFGRQNYEEEQAWIARKKVMEEEVGELEARRKRALIPLEQQEKELQNKESALLKREEIIVIKETDLEQTRSLLEDKLDVVSEREQDANEYALSLNTREMNIKLQEEELGNRMSALTQILQESFEEIKTSQAEDAQRKAILKGKDVTLAEREKLVTQAENSFANREKAINDKYRALQQAITHTKLKQ